MIPKKLSPAIFGLAVLCFFLPWVNVSCQGQKIVSLSGFQLATGTTVQQPQVLGQPVMKYSPKEPKKVSGDPVAIIALIVTLAGIALGFLRGKINTYGSMAAGAAGVILLVALRSRISGEAAKAGGLLQIDYGFGYYITLLLFFAAIASNFLALKEPGSAQLSPGGHSPVTDTKFCTQCGAENEAKNTFCNSCGFKFP